MAHNKDTSTFAASNGGEKVAVCDRNMCNFATPPAKDKVKVGIIGLGQRGRYGEGGAMHRLPLVADAEITALCDIDEAQVLEAQKKLREVGRPEAKSFFGSEEAWKRMIDLDLDLVYIATPWKQHAMMSLHAMLNGKHAAVEVPAALTLDECWALVETSEKSGRHCMMLENCCYDFFELQTFNMVRQGVFGELTHAEGAYIHNMCNKLSLDDEKNGKIWRFKQNDSKNGNLYPTHGLGPIAQCMNINRGNQFSYMVSMSSQEAAFTDYAVRHGREKYTHLKHYRSDMNTSLIKCVKGQTIMLQHDISTPRPYSRIYLLQGTGGIAYKWPVQNIALAGKDEGHEWLNPEELKELEAKYEHPLSRTIGSIARKIGGHGGMDFIMDYRLIYCLKHGLSLDMDVYDAAAWSCITPLSIESVSKKSVAVDVPDFTRGAWKTNVPLGVVDVDLSETTPAG
ncbi:MAG: Gfo/Idh/MocA family oxidoreductase [Kiritimatiellales bacterium]